MRACTSSRKKDEEGQDRVFLAARRREQETKKVGWVFYASSVRYIPTYLPFWTSTTDECHLVTTHTEFGTKYAERENLESPPPPLKKRGADFTFHIMLPSKNELCPNP